MSTSDNERMIPDRVADAITRLVAHELGHQLGLVPNGADLQLPIQGPILTKLGVSAFGTNSHHRIPSANPPSLTDFEFIMHAETNITLESAWDSGIFRFDQNEIDYLTKILPK